MAEYICKDDLMKALGERAGMYAINDLKTYMVLEKVRNIIEEMPVVNSVPTEEEVLKIITKIRSSM